MKRILLHLSTILALVLTGFLWAPTILAQSSSAEWIVQINGFQNGSEFAKDGMAIDNDGNVYLCGETSGSNSDIFVRKYSSNGQLIWSDKYGSKIGGDRAHTIALDNSGNVYVTGESYTDSHSGVDMITIKYDNDGDMQWDARYSGPGSDWDSGHAIVADNSGNVYVTGLSRTGGFTGSSLTDNSDYVTIKYNSSGHEQWVVRYNGPGDVMDFVKDIGIDNSGNVYITGASSSSGQNRDYATIKYDNDGNQIWIDRYSQSSSSDDYAVALSVDQNGNVYVTGANATIKYDSDGTRQWVVTGIRGADIVANEHGVYVTGWAAGIGGADFVTAQYSDDGIEQWRTQYNGPNNGIDRAVALEVDRFGSAFINGITGYGSPSQQDFVTIKYDKNGVENWLNRYNSPENGDDWVTALRVDASGNVFVTGVTIAEYPDPSDSVLIKYRNQPPELNPIGDRTVNEGESLSFTVTGVDPDGDTLICTGANLPDSADFNPESGTFTWTPDFDSSGVFANVRFGVSEGYYDFFEDISIIVIDVNRPPKFSPIGNKSVDEGELLTFSVQADDPDGDSLTYSVSSLPDGATFDSTTNTVTWTPEFNQEGSYSIHFEVSDGDLSVSENAAITVNNVTQPFWFIVGGGVGIVIIVLIVMLVRQRGNAA